MKKKFVLCDKKPIFFRFYYFSIRFLFIGLFDGDELMRKSKRTKSNEQQIIKNESTLRRDERNAKMKMLRNE